MGFGLQLRVWDTKTIAEFGGLTFFLFFFFFWTTQVCWKVSNFLRSQLVAEIGLQVKKYGNIYILDYLG